MNVIDCWPDIKKATQINQLILIYLAKEYEDPATDMRNNTIMLVHLPEKYISL